MLLILFLRKVFHETIQMYNEKGTNMKKIQHTKKVVVDKMGMGRRRSMICTSFEKREKISHNTICKQKEMQLKEVSEIEGMIYIRQGIEVGEGNESILSNEDNE